jgi:hypothetical protein
MQSETVKHVTFICVTVMYVIDKAQLQYNDRLPLMHSHCSHLHMLATTLYECLVTLTV